MVRKPVNALDMAVVVNTDPTKEPIDALVAVVPDQPRVWPVPPRWAQATVPYGIGTMAIFWFLQRAVALM